MKKVLFLFVLMLSAGVIANAQFRFGIKAAANFATTNGEGDETKVGFSAGFLGQIKLNDRWAIQPELLYNLQGPKGKVSGAEVKLNAGYVAVPVMAQFYVIDGLYVEAGPQVGILTNATWKREGSDGVDFKDYLEPVEVSFNMGVAYELKAAPVGFFIRGSFGITRFAKKDTKYNFDEDLRSQSFQLGAFVKF